MKKIKKYLRFAAIIGLLVTLHIGTAFASDNEIIWDKYLKSYVKNDKVWTIKFNMTLEEADSIEDYVYVQDSKGDRAPVNVQLKNDTVVVSPTKSYEKGETYKLIIEKELKSSNGVPLKQRVIMPFNIEDNEALVKGKLKSELLLAQKEVVIKEYNINKDEIVELVNGIINNTPEIFYYGGFSYNYETSQGIVDSIIFNYTYTSQEIEDMKIELNTKIDWILNNVVNDSMNDYEKELAIHDYIINNAVYDIENLNNNTLKDSAYSMYGILIEGKAVCTGYAKTMQYFLDKFNIENQLIFGNANGESHVWNLVKLNGAYYHLDATFDDPISKEENILRRNYFNISDELIKKSHVWNEEDYIKAISMEQNYFVKNESYAKDEAELISLIKKKIKNNEKDINILVKDMIVDIPSIVRKSGYKGAFSYSFDDAIGVVSVNLK
ncbi:transglutaminase domain-containing protein [Oceanirhabdus sp. W0125-5]|uniref:transglutaminase domain-containing protein n=1 Tax=Oceanirhabdus sp. W0125-5 TaxID=2999116 RepID=UPI0022F3477A|nr:transglutaminase domain-containing protein [Oceanirhabdus sp. W0125-5]WBW94714.1 transglutaminase domain-containing protein [Oceanirhabdus sp. W0125-5]